MCVCVCVHDVSRIQNLVLSVGRNDPAKANDELV